MNSADREKENAELRGTIAAVQAWRRTAGDATWLELDAILGAPALPDPRGERTGSAFERMVDERDTAIRERREAIDENAVLYEDMKRKIDTAIRERDSCRQRFSQHETREAELTRERDQARADHERDKMIFIEATEIAIRECAEARAEVAGLMRHIATAEKHTVGVIVERDAFRAVIEDARAERSRPVIHSNPSVAHGWDGAMARIERILDAAPAVADEPNRDVVLRSDYERVCVELYNSKAKGQRRSAEITRLLAKGKADRETLKAVVQCGHGWAARAEAAEAMVQRQAAEIARLTKLLDGRTARCLEWSYRAEAAEAKIEKAVALAEGGSPHSNPSMLHGWKGAMSAVLAILRPEPSLVDLAGVNPGVVDGRASEEFLADARPRSADAKPEAACPGCGHLQEIHRAGFCAGCEPDYRCIAIDELARLASAPTQLNVTFEITDVRKPVLTLDLEPPEDAPLPLIPPDGTRTVPVTIRREDDPDPLPLPPEDATEAGTYTEPMHQAVLAEMRRQGLDWNNSYRAGPFWKRDRAFFLAGIRHAEERGRWIPVEERLPGMYVPVIATIGADTVVFGIMRGYVTDFETTRWERQNVALNDQNVTAWRPLPKPYKAGGGR